MQMFTHLGGLRAFIAETHCSRATWHKITKVFAMNGADSAQVGEGLNGYCVTPQTSYYSVGRGALSAQQGMLVLDPSVPLPWKRWPIFKNIMAIKHEFPHTM
jgi:hypothetical protein